MEYMWAGKILSVDLTRKDYNTIPTKKYRKGFFGGRGINSRLLFENVSPEIQPLDPENVLLFGTGPFTGTLFPGSGRLNIMTKSPMSGLEGTTNVGGMISPEIKYAGYDHIMVKGRFEKPVYLFINNDVIQFRDASHLWGKDNYETASLIRQELGDEEVQILSIGPAGENLVHYANIMTKVGNAAGRTGSGAVMGSKNLKAIAVRGTLGIKIKDQESFKEICLKAHEILKKTSRAKNVRLYGTTISSDSHSSIGGSPVMNFRSTQWEGYENTSSYKFMQQNFNRRTGCFGCPTHCMDNYKVAGIGNGIVSCMGYRDLSDRVMLEDQKKWWQAMLLCQKNGMDTTSAGGMLSWAMELYERGIITKKDTDGIPLEWGRPDAILAMLEKIIYRDGFGDILASNPREAILALGSDTEEYLIHTKGMPLYQRNQQNYRARALSLAVDPRGDSIAGRPPLESSYQKVLLKEEGEEKERILYGYYEAAEQIAGSRDAIMPKEYTGKAKMVKLTQDSVCLSDMLSFCRIHGFWEGLDGLVDFHIQAKALSAGCGEEVSVRELLTAVERIFAQERAFAVREGITRDRDQIPKRFFKEPMKGFFPDDVIDEDGFEKMKDEYYQLRGWEKISGTPSEDLLLSLDLHDVAKDLGTRGLLPESSGEKKPFLFEGIFHNNEEE